MALGLLWRLAHRHRCMDLRCVSIVELLMHGLPLGILVDPLASTSLHAQGRLHFILARTMHEHGETEAGIARMLKQTLLLEHLAVDLVEAHLNGLILLRQQ